MQQRRSRSFESERVGAEELLLIVLLLLLGAMSNMVSGQRFLKERLIVVESNESLETSTQEKEADTLHIKLEPGQQMHLQMGESRIGPLTLDACAKDAFREIGEEVAQLQEWSPESLVRVQLHAPADTPLCAWAQVRSFVSSIKVSNSKKTISLELEVLEHKPGQERKP